MRLSSVFAVVLPFGALAVPVDGASTILFRQSPRPPPCVSRANVTLEETRTRFEKFANAFLVTKNITEAFTYIREDYINNGAPTGSAAAWNFLSPIWGNQNITVIRTRFDGRMSWLNYQSAFGNIIDRFRWDGGCIAEHWDRGETWPPA